MARSCESHRTCHLSITSSDFGGRWIFWVLMISAGSCRLLCLLFLPETFAPVLLTQKAKNLHWADPLRNKDVYAESERVSWTPNDILQRTVFCPFKVLGSILLLSTVYLSVVYCLVYGSACAARFHWKKMRYMSDVRLCGEYSKQFLRYRILHFPIANDGLVFIGLGIGTVLVGVVTFDSCVHILAYSNNGTYILPLRNAWTLLWSVGRCLR